MKRGGDFSGQISPRLLMGIVRGVWSRNALGGLGLLGLVGLAGLLALGTLAVSPALATDAKAEDKHPKAPGKDHGTSKGAEPKGAEPKGDAHHHDHGHGDKNHQASGHDDGHSKGEHHDDGHHKDGHHGGHHELTIHGEKPKNQLGPGTEPLYVSPQLFLWTLGVFLILLFLLSQMAWKPILYAMEVREHRIEEALKEAKEAREEAKTLFAAHDLELGKAHEEAKRLLEQARAEAAKECEIILAAAKAATVKTREEAELQLAAAKDAALLQIRDAAAPLAAKMAGRVVSMDFSPDGCRHMVEEALT